MKMITIVILIAAVVCGGLAVGALYAFSGQGGQPQTKSGEVTVDSLIEVQKNPPPDYIEELTLIIKNNNNQTIRDIAVNILTDIAIRKSEPEKIMDFLKDLAAHEDDIVIMSAAYASIDLIRDMYPLPQMGSLNLSVSGDVRKGGEVAIIATFASIRDTDWAILGFDFPHDQIEPITPPFTYTNLTTHTTSTYTFRVRILEKGEVKITAQLALIIDLTDYEQTEREVRFVVRENDGEYFIV